MNKPEDNPALVYLFACINRLGRDYKNLGEAISQAQYELRESRELIKLNQEPDWEEFECEYGTDGPMTREEFINLLINGVCKDKRFKRREAFAVKWWAELKAQHPEAPTLEEPTTWKSATLLRWKHVFRDIHSKRRMTTNRANRQKNMR